MFMGEKTAYGRKVEKLWSEGLNLIFPMRCPVCDRPAPYAQLSCPACRARLAVVAEPRCLKCGKHIEDEGEEYCGGCRRAVHRFEAGRGLYSYRQMAMSLYRFKYAGRREYACFYAEQIVKRLGRRIWGWRPDALVPVPIHTSRRRQRGYNQAEVLAREIGKRTGIPVVSNLLRRVKNTLPQKMLDDAGRQNNLKRAFKIERNDVKLERVILIDDIYTTGSTMDACADKLREAGVKKVYFITVAIGEDIR